MKYIIIVLLLCLAGCSTDKQEMKKIQKDEKIEEKRTKEPIYIEKESIIGEAITNILDKGENRVNNICVSCEKINGTELKAGEIFSFNAATGERSPENGYKKAPVLIDGEKNFGIGGGVCQVSTTIYLSAVNANLSIIEHHNHSEPVAYAPKGKDATVVYGAKDLKIQNNTENSVYIYTWVEGGKVFSKIIQKSIDIQ